MTQPTCELSEMVKKTDLTPREVSNIVRIPYRHVLLLFDSFNVLYPKTERRLRTFLKYYEENGRTWSKNYDKEKSNY